MTDSTYPSVYFAYIFFLAMAGGALFFFFRSLRHGYLGENSEEPKYRMLEDEPTSRYQPDRESASKDASGVRE